ncbi:MAG: MarC family protein [Thermodesulfobacteriaceae bacterium]|nr:MarC family protein [Thermodesulfobacteriaceae bacterium]MDW8136004.1 MarC family protein [Thermodesulfobacterium sp.]
MEIGFLIKSFLAIFTIVDPIGAVPLFLNITSNYSREERKRVAFMSSVTVLVTLTIFLWIGKLILNFFHISISSFKIAGGALLFITAIEMLFGRVGQVKTSAQEMSYFKEKEDIAIVPLGIPYLAGPGAITTVIILGENTTLIQKVSLFFIIGGVALSIYLFLSQAYLIFKFLGELGTKATIRILGLILATIATEYILTGIKETFKL